MEQKSNKGLVWLIIILTLLMLTQIGFIVYDNFISDSNKKLNNSTTSNTNNIYPEELVFKDTLENETCLDISALGYYDYNFEKSYEVEIQNNNNVYKYITNTELGVELEYFNGVLIKTKPDDQPLLSQICNYQDYLFTVEGWEGQPAIKLISEEGEIVWEGYGNYDYNNGILNIISISYTNFETYSEGIYKERSIDLTKDLIEEKITKTTEFDCNDYYNIDNDNSSEEEKEISGFCVY